MKQQTKFKQTEIGEIPEDWEVDVLKNVLIEPPRNGIYKSKSFHGTGIRIVNMGELFRFSRIGNQEMRLINLNDSEKERFLVRAGDLLFARRSLVAEGAGKCSLVVEHNSPMAFESSLIKTTPNKEKIDSEFLFYFFISEKGHYLMDTILRQVAVSGITGKDLSNLMVPLPRIKEQYAIAKILSDLDAKIELNQQMNKTLETIGQALFKHWFIENDNLPKSWETKPLDKIAEFLNGLALQKYPAQEGEEFLPVIKIRELRNGITDATDKAAPNIPEEYIIKDGDILFSWSGSLEVEVWTKGKGALNQHLFKVSSEEYPKWFYYFWTKKFLPEFRGIAEGKATTMGHIQRRHLSESQVIIPDKKSLEKMDKVMTALFDKMILLNVQSNNLTKIRDLLLPKLMSGKIRVNIR